MVLRRYGAVLASIVALRVWQAFPMPGRNLSSIPPGGRALRRRSRTSTSATSGPAGRRALIRS